MATLEQRIAALEERALEERAGTDYDLTALTQEERDLWAVLVKKADGFTPAGLAPLTLKELKLAERLLVKMSHHSP